MSRSSLIVIVAALVCTLVGAPAVTAQEGVSESRGITTIGYGTASAPAEVANLQFLIINENFYGGPPQAPQVEATPGAAARATVAPISEAIDQSDAVESVEVVIPQVSGIYGGPSPVARIDITVLTPDRETLAQLVTEVTQAAAGERLLVGFVGASFETSDCHALESEARQVALEDARSRAGIQAGLIGVELGEIVSTADVDSTSGLAIGVYGGLTQSASGCEPHVAPDFSDASSMGMTLPGFDPASHSGEVEIYRQVQVTFAIADPAT